MKQEHREACRKWNAIMRKAFHTKHGEDSSLCRLMLHDYARNAILTARKNDYILDSGNGEIPMVFLWAYTYNSDGNIEEKSELANSLKGIIQENDVLLSDDAPSSEVDLGAARYSGLAGELQDYFLKKNIRMFFNDDEKSIHLQNINSVQRCELKKEPGFDPSGFENLELIRDFVEIVEKRNASVCYDSSYSIISTLRDIKNSGRVHQLCMQALLRAGNIQEALKGSGIPYLVFVPKVNPLYKGKC